MAQHFLKSYLDYQTLTNYHQLTLQRAQWKPAMTFILWGLTLMMLQVQYLFEYAFLLPAAGILLTFLGFYRLRGENKSMCNCYRLSLVAMVLYPLYLLSNATPLFYLSWFITGFQILFLLYQLALLFFLRNGLKAIFQQMNSKASGDPVLMLILWTVLLQVIAYTSYASSMLIWLLFSVAFLLCLWVVWMHVINLYNDGYLVKTKIGILHAGWCMGAYALVIALFMISGTIFTFTFYF